MISWRGFFVNTLPEHASEQQGIAVTTLLSGLTALLLVPVWRGGWRPSEHTFALRFFGTFLVTMLAAFDCHLHAAALLIVPGGAAYVSGATPRVLKALMRVSIYVPAVVFGLLIEPELLTWFFFGACAVSLVVCVATLVRRPTGSTTSSADLVSVRLRAALGSHA
jgi:hypothetical protein